MVRCCRQFKIALSGDLGVGLIKWLTSSLPQMAIINIAATQNTLISDLLGCYHAKGLVNIWGNFPAKWQHVVNEPPPSPLETHQQSTVIELGLKVVFLQVACNVNERIKTERHIPHPTVQVALVLTQARLARFHSQWHHNRWGGEHIVQPFQPPQPHRQQCDPLWFLRLTRQMAHTSCDYETI